MIQQQSVIRSFVKREGRMTNAQKNNYNQYYNEFLIKKPVGEMLNWPDVFGTTGPVIIEIGFGMGASLAQIAIQNPTINFVGIEVYRPGIGALLGSIVANKLANLKIYEGDAVEFFTQSLSSGSVDKVHIFFPDPWHKVRHHKRRLIGKAFLAVLADKIRKGGYIHIATDWLPYAHSINTFLKESDYFTNINQSDVELLPTRPVTKFEIRGHKLGHIVTDLYAQCE